MNPLGIAILVGVSLSVCVGSRRVAMLALMAGILFLPETQNIDVAGFNCFGIRIIGVIAFARVILKGEFSVSKIGVIDKAVLILYLYSRIVFSIRTSENLAYSIGSLIDALAAYFACRGLAGDPNDIRWFLRRIVVLLVPYTCLVLIESHTSQNPFSLLGNSTGGEWFREGRIRCIGSFRHPSLLGTLGATLIPFYIALLMTRSNRLIAVIGIVLCILIVWASNSGGPVFCAATGFVSWGIWLFRSRMKLVRRTLAATIVVLALVMKAPIWYILARASAFSGGDGWHRSYLMDVTYQHFHEWWLVGMPIRKTAGWFPYDLETTGGSDITNEFISFALDAGILAMALFIVLIIQCFKQVGKGMDCVDETNVQGKEDKLLLWGTGAMLVGHIFNWLGITYFDQTYFLWFMQLAFLANIAEYFIRSNRAAEMSDARSSHSFV